MVLSGVPRKKSPLTPPGIDPGTVRLVAQRLYHYATPGPHVYVYIYIFIYIYIYIYIYIPGLHRPLPWKKTDYRKHTQSGPANQVPKMLSRSPEFEHLCLQYVALALVDWIPKVLSKTFTSFSRLLRKCVHSKRRKSLT